MIFEYQDRHLNDFIEFIVLYSFLIIYSGNIFRLYSLAFLTYFIQD